MIDAPSSESGKGPKMGSRGYRKLGGGIRVLAPYLVVWGYVCIYRRKEYVGGATGGHEGGGRAPLPRVFLVDCLT